MSPVRAFSFSSQKQRGGRFPAHPLYPFKKDNIAQYCLLWKEKLRAWRPDGEDDGVEMGRNGTNPFEHSWL
jgi:hypothetical protein